MSDVVPREFRLRKPLTLEAMQFDGQNGGDIVDWLSDAGVVTDVGDNYGDELFVTTLYDTLRVPVSDWVVLFSDGVFDVCDEKFFSETYEEVEE